MSPTRRAPETKLPVPIRRAPVLLLVSVIAFASAAGCSGPAPDRHFVEQANRLHTDVLAAAVRDDGDLPDYVQTIGNRIVEAARAAAPNKARAAAFGRMRFHVVDCDTVNVFGTGGTHIYVYDGLLRLCESEEELAAAIAHAYAHAVNLDVQNTNVRPDPDLPLRQAAYAFVTNRFTAEQDRRADDLAFLIYARGGWDPAKFGNLFQRLSDRFPGNPAPDRRALAERARTAQRADSPSRNWRRPPIADRRSYLALRRAASAAPRTSASRDADVVLRAFPNCLLAADQPEQVEAQNLLRPPPPPAAKLEPS